MKINNQYETIRNEVKKLMVDRGFGKWGGQIRLARELGLNYQALNMALTGFRRTRASMKLLEVARSHLRTT